jgi:putative flavoprotein involved in K+ transport
VIIGAGQAGLAVSYCLSQHGEPHIVLEQADCPGSAWKYGRWDSFTLNTPNWGIRLPGGEYAGASPDGFLGRDELVAYFANYQAGHELPVRFGVRVIAVERCGTGYIVQTEGESWQAARVVVAAGLYQQPKIPRVNADLPDGILQMHSGEYRNPETLPPGSVLVVGSGQSGAQIAEELYQSGRRVYLSVSSAGRVPRRYRGRDTFYWLNASGFLSSPPSQLPSPGVRFAANPHVSGSSGGHTINLHQFAMDGVVLLGHLGEIRSGKIEIQGDLGANLKKADEFEAWIVRIIDEYIEKNDIDVPPERLPLLQDGYQQPEIRELDLQSAGISAVIWATGYRFDFRWVKLPVFDSYGFPVQSRGVTSEPGLYFVGLPWLVNQKSGLLMGVGEDAAYIATHIAGDVR